MVGFRTVKCCAKEEVKGYQLSLHRVCDLICGLVHGSDICKILSYMHLFMVATGEIPTCIDIALSLCVYSILGY